MITMPKPRKKTQPSAELTQLRERLAEAESVIEAIRQGEVDALVDAQGNIFTLRSAETAYRIIVETMHEGAMTVDADGLILWANAALCELLGVELSELNGRLFRDFMLPIHRDAFDELVSRALDGLEARDDFRIIRKDDRFVPVYLSSSRLDLPDHRLVTVIVSDLTERRTIEEKLQQLNAELEAKVEARTDELNILNENLEEMVIQRTRQVHDLSRALTVAEQSERQRLAQVLYDDLQQILFSAKIQLDMLDQDLGELSAQNADDFNQLRTLIEKSIRSCRTMALELNPPILRTEGLDAAIGWLASHMSERYGLNVKTNISENISQVRESDRVLIIQTIRELLFNSAKHSRSKEVLITGERRDGHLRIVVEDKGVGFDPEKIRGEAPTLGMGLFGIEERLHLFGGELDIQSSPGKGTRAVVTLPYAEPRK